MSSTSADGEAVQGSAVQGSDSSPDARRVDKSAAQFDTALEMLAGARAFAKPRYQVEVHRLATQLLESAGGLHALYDRADRFEDAGVFYGGPWDDASELQPSLVGGCYRGDGSVPTLEAMSELRMLAIATGRGKSNKISQNQARDFLREVVALNLEFLFPEEGEDSRQRPLVIERARRVFSLVGAQLSLDGLRDEVAEEILDIAAQHPIVTARVRKLIRLAENLPGQVLPDATGGDKLVAFVDATRGPSPLSREHPEPAAYLEALTTADDALLTSEAAFLSRNMRVTGLAHPTHAVLLRRLAKYAPDLVGAALGLNQVGLAELEQNRTLAHQLIKVAIRPDTADSIFGFACLLERGLISRSEVSVGLRRLIELDLDVLAKQNLLAARPKSSGLAPNAVLVAGAISVLGQPLGIGQGENPTCQAARGISLWALHAPSKLLDYVAHAARDGVVEVEFEGATLRSNELGAGELLVADLSLDAVQIVLVPHLNRIYDQLMVKCSLRAEDGHKWVNPAMYGSWVSSGFAAAMDNMQVVHGYRDFVRRFFATHHPSYNDGYELLYPNPVGLLVTDVRGRYLGPHAVSIQRITTDPSGELRVYFFNPHSEARQRWGAEIATSVRGAGERPGESSLAFAHFASRLYAFHYDPYEEGEAYAVPNALVLEVEKSARESWGAAFSWDDSKD